MLSSEPGVGAVRPSLTVVRRLVRALERGDAAARRETSSMKFPTSRLARVRGRESSSLMS